MLTPRGSWNISRVSLGSAQADWLVSMTVKGDNPVKKPSSS
jgi:hypothetical protein